MKTIILEPLINDQKKQNAMWEGIAPTSKDVKITYTEKEDLLVKRPDGSVLCFLSRGGISKELTKGFYNAIANTGAISKTDLRGKASGLDSVNKTKKDGTKSNTSRTNGFVQSSIVGYFDRYPRINYCRKTSWTQKNPAHWDCVTRYTERVDEIYRENCPNEYLEHREVANKTSPDFMIGKSVFTTVTLNRNFRTHYHRDAGNLKEGIAAMSFIKTGKFSGGEIVFPNYGVALRLRSFDLVVFDNSEIHGNLPIIPISKVYERITSVFFYRKGMVFCGTVEQELDRAKKNKGDNLIGPTTEDLNKGQFK
jgi:hypothetical protein